jgi:hypothetical protein
MRIHVLPGDAQVEEFKRTGIDGRIVVCREALVDGDVRGESLDEFWKVRESFLAETYPESPLTYRENVVAEFEKLIDLPAGTEVNLWFEYELFCHVNMWFCVWLLRDSAAEIYRVAPVEQPSDQIWSGFGGLTSDQLGRCFDARVKFAPRDVVLGSDLWSAYQSRDYGKLRELSIIESECFPYLREACEAEIEKETRPKQVLRELREDGIEEFGEMFAGFKEKAGVYGYGDSQVQRILTEI